MCHLPCRPVCGGFELHSLILLERVKTGVYGYLASDLDHKIFSASSCDLTTLASSVGGGLLDHDSSAVEEVNPLHFNAQMEVKCLLPFSVDDLAFSGITGIRRPHNCAGYRNYGVCIN